MLRTGSSNRTRAPYLGRDCGLGPAEYFASSNQSVYRGRMSSRPTALPAAPPAPTASAEATELFFAVGTVVKRLRRHPLPGHDDLSAVLHGRSPAPRHIVALVQVAADGPIGMSDLADRLAVSLATA